MSQKLVHDCELCLQCTKKINIKQTSIQIIMAAE